MTARIQSTVLAAEGEVNRSGQEAQPHHRHRHLGQPPSSRIKVTSGKLTGSELTTPNLQFCHKRKLVKFNTKNRLL